MMKNNKLSNIYKDYLYIDYYKRFNINILKYLSKDILLSLNILELNNKINDFKNILASINFNEPVSKYVKYLLQKKYLGLQFIKYLAIGYQKKDYNYHTKSFDIQKQLYGIPTDEDYQSALADFSHAIYFVLSDKKVKSNKKKIIEKYHHLFINKGIPSVSFFNFHRENKLINSFDVYSFIKELIKILKLNQVKLSVSKADNFSAIKNILYYPKKKLYYIDILRATIHELLHICTYINANNVYTNDGKKIFYLSKQNVESLRYQEGLAVLYELDALKNYNNFRILEYAMRLIFTYELINYPNNNILFDRLRKIYYVNNIICNNEFDEKKSDNKYIYFLNRIKQGFDNNTNYVFLKYWNYWKGYNIVKNLKNKDEFLIGKVSDVSLKMVKKIGIKYEDIIKPNTNLIF